MSKLYDDKIGTREFFAIILIAIGMKVKDATPSFLYEHGENAAWLIPVFYIFTVGIPLLVLVHVMKKQSKGLIELIFHLTGRIGGSVICFLLFFLLFLSITYYSRSYVSIANTLFYPKTSTVILTFALLVTGYFVAKRGLNVIASTAWLFIPLIEVSFVILLALVWNTANWLQLFPLAGPGIGVLAKEAVNTSAFFGELILLAAFFPFVRSFENYRLASFLGFGIAIMKMALFLAVYIAVFDYPSTVLMAYPHQELTRIAKVGTTFTHLEGGFFLFWLIASIVRFAIYFYLMALLLGGMLRFNQVEKLLLPLFGLIALASLLPENVFTMYSYRDFSVKIGSWVAIILPFILLLLHKLKGGGKNEKADDSAC